MLFVRRVKKISLPEVIDNRGRLIFAEAGQHIPFSIKRIFTIYDIPRDQVRGAHAHRAQHQFVIMQAGRCTVTVDEGADKFEEQLDSPVQGLYVPPLVWISLKDFIVGSVCLVLTSGHFDETDYVWDYAEFRQLVAAR